MRRGRARRALAGPNQSTDLTPAARKALFILLAVCVCFLLFETQPPEGLTSGGLRFFSSQAAESAGNDEHAGRSSPTHDPDNTTGDPSQPTTSTATSKGRTSSTGRSHQRPQPPLAHVLTHAGAGASGAIAAGDDVTDDGGGSSVHMRAGDMGLTCSAVGARYSLLPDGTIIDVPRLDTSFDAWVFQYTPRVHYAHMAMVEKMPSGLLVAAWQATASPIINNHMVTEGLPQQSIYFSVSKDGGRSWGPPVPVNRGPGSSRRAAWGPVLHCDAGGALWLFYSESHMCMKATVPPTWSPGGDIRVVKLVDLRQAKWSAPRTILRQSQGDGVPKVIANKPAILSTGEWVLPFWSEQAASGNCTRGTKVGSSSSSERGGGGGSAGVLLSQDEGRTWHASAPILDSRTPLLEGTVVELREKGSLLMLFRTNTDCVFKSTSHDRGKTWSPPVPVPLPNPNSKLSLAVLQPWGHLVLAFNNHLRPTSLCRACRTHLHLALSTDEGDSWHHVGEVDGEATTGLRTHYPSMVQAGDLLLVVHSRFYLGSKLGLSSQAQGIRLVAVDLRGIPRAAAIVHAAQQQPLALPGKPAPGAGAAEPSQPISQVELGVYARERIRALLDPKTADDARAAAERFVASGAEVGARLAREEEEEDEGSREVFATLDEAVATMASGGTGGVRTVRRSVPADGEGGDDDGGGDEEGSADEDKIKGAEEDDEEVDDAEEPSSR
eukprot:jgi/Mesvir1/14310/Mv09730-RA.1